MFEQPLLQEPFFFSHVSVVFSSAGDTNKNSFHPVGREVRLTFKKLGSWKLVFRCLQDPMLLFCVQGYGGDYT